MPKERRDKRSSRTQCHFISNTHWDREWRFSAQRTRYMLVETLDRLFEIFEKEPKYRSFHLDSQTLPIQDYLETCPEREDVIRKYVSEGRLKIGPWFCLPDEFCVGSGEALIRNLLLGHRIARKFGGVSKTGYSPFSWGQISQMPQIYKGFGINVMTFYRGVSTIRAPRSEFYWEGADGTRIVATRMAAGGRCNVWHTIQRPVYWDRDPGEQDAVWGHGHGPFHFVDQDNAHLDYRYTHPKHRYHQERVAECAERALRKQDGQWSTPHR
ncbi:MAG: hypothetical protein GWP08_13485, partial [Nitrospiraceae bacterium]|nr:hypothetical protein [Nitrospiraceae bacterium]